MSKMGEMVLEIEERLNQGMTPETIAKHLSIPISWVTSVEDTLGGQDFNHTEEEQYYAEHQ